jgi:DNA repair exonuclease SbcCD ATPase subunit
MKNGQTESNKVLEGSLSNIANHQEAQHNRLTTNIEDLLKQVGNTVTVMQSNVTELRRTTTDAISGMNSGADKMKNAADRFATAGQSVSGIMEKATPMATQMTTSTNTLAQASQQLANGITQYEKTRIETARHVESLQKLLDVARQETGIKKELINDIQHVTDTLRNTEKQSIEYLEKVNKVLIQSFQDFGSAMKNQVSQSITQTDNHLSSGVNQLTGVIQELGAQLQRMRSRG